MTGFFNNELITPKIVSERSYVLPITSGAESAFLCQFLKMDQPMHARTQALVAYCQVCVCLCTRVQYNGM